MANRTDGTPQGAYRGQRSPDMPEEEWRPVPSLGGRYAASSFGRVRGPSGRVLKTVERPANGVRGGYRSIVISTGGRVRAAYIHRLVAEAFLGACPPHKQVAHQNGERGDNRPSNLAYLTPRDNTQQKYEHGTVVHGPAHHATTLTEDRVMAIRAVPYRRGVLTLLAQEYGVCRQTISNIRGRKTWKFAA